MGIPCKVRIVSDLKYFAIIVDGLLVFTQFVVGDAAVVLGLDKLRVDLNGHAVFCDGLLMLTLFHIGIATRLIYI